MNWKTLKRHKYNTVPNCDDKEFEELKQSIADNGYDYKYPIYIYQGPSDKELFVIDGMQRLTACIALCEEGLDIQPLVREFKGTDEDAIQFIIKSIKRRNLNAGQRSATYQELNEKLIKVRERDAKKSQTSGLNIGTDSRGPDIMPTGRTDEFFAGQAGVSKQTYQHTKAIKKYSEDLFKKVKDGSISANAAYRHVQEQSASEDKQYKINANKITNKLINEAAQKYGPQIRNIVEDDLRAKGNTNIKLKIVIDD